MSFAARDWIESRHPPWRGRASEPTSDDDMAASLREALLNADEDLRRRYPGVFRLADAVKKRPNRRPQVMLNPSTSRYRMSDCDWCGDWFLSTRHTSRGWSRFCNGKCAWAYWRYWKKRANER